MDIERLGSKTAPTTTMKSVATKRSSHQTSQDVSFKSVLTNKSLESHKDRLNAAFVKIEDQGRRLVEHRTMEELRKYKSLVKNYMEEVVRDGYELEERMGFNPRGKSKLYKMVEEVDSKLVQLTKDIIANEKGHLQILEQVGEIRGMLLNLYA